MKIATHGGKGSTARPIINKAQFEANWDNIFSAEVPTIYKYYCSKCDTNLEEPDVWLESVKDHYDMGDQRVWETREIPHCENCSSSQLVPYSEHLKNG